MGYASSIFVDWFATMQNDSPERPSLRRLYSTLVLVKRITQQKRITVHGRNWNQINDNYQETIVSNEETKLFQSVDS